MGRVGEGQINRCGLVTAYLANGYEMGTGQ
jgi:hypothetical protein